MAFFGFPAKDGQFVEKDKKKRNEVTCKLCFQVLKCVSNTTNMRFHLQTRHHREYAAMEPQERTRPASSGSSTSAGSTTLVQLAKQYLAIPATSVPSERAFSAAGHIANERMSCLLPDSITMLVFLAENLH